MKLEAARKQGAHLLEAGEQIVGAVKATPRGSLHEIILGGAGASAFGQVAPALGGAGFELGRQLGQSESDEGRNERSEADVDVGRVSQVVLLATDRRILLCSTSFLGKIKEVLATVDRTRVTHVSLDSTSLFGQTMPEVLLQLDDEHEVGFGVAKIHRQAAEALVGALSTPGV